MKLFEKFKNKNEAPVANIENRINEVDIEQLPPELQESILQIDSRVTKITEGLVPIGKSDERNWKKITTYGDKILRTSSFSEPGIGYARTVTYEDEGIRVELVSGADFDTAQSHSSITIDNPDINADTSTVKVDFTENGRIVLRDGDAASSSEAALKVLNAIGPVITEVAAKGSSS